MEAEPTTYLPTYLALGFVAVAATVAIVFNSVVLFAVYRKNVCWRVLSFQLIALSSIVDIICGFSIVLMVLIRVCMSTTSTFSHSWYCSIFGFSTVFFSGIGGVILSCLACERFLLICLQRSLSPKIMWVLLSIITIIFFTLCMGTAAENLFIHDPTFSHCVPGDHGWAKWLSRGTGFIFVIPLILLTIFYSAIFFTSYRLAPVSTHFIPRTVAIRAVIFLIVYYICFLPKFIGSLWGLVASRESRPNLVYILSPCGLALVMAINPFLALFLHNPIREEAKRIIFGSKSLNPSRASLANVPCIPIPAYHKCDQHYIG